MWDLNDQALMDSLRELGPLLTGTRRRPESSEEDMGNKRHKPVPDRSSPEKGDPTQALIGLVRVLATVWR